MSGGLREAVEALRLAIDEACPHGTEGNGAHPEGTCETCDYAFQIDTLIEEALAPFLAEHPATGDEGCCWNYPHAAHETPCDPAEPDAGEVEGLTEAERAEAWDEGVRHAAAHIGVSPNGSLLAANPYRATSGGAQ